MTESPPDKRQLHTLWRAHLETKLIQVRAGQDSAREGTRVDGEHRPSNRGERAAVTNQGYLAHGMGQRIEDIETSLQLLERVGTEPREQVVMGALLSILCDDDTMRWLAVLPGGDATVHVLDNTPIQVLSPQAPLIQELMGLEVGDMAEVSQGVNTMSIEVAIVL